MENIKDTPWLNEYVTACSMCTCCEGCSCTELCEVYNGTGDGVPVLYNGWVAGMSNDRKE